MKNKFISLILCMSICLSLSAFQISAQEIEGQFGFYSSELTEGEISAVLKLESAPEEVLFAIGYYLSDNTLYSCVTKTVSDTSMQTVSITIPETVSFGDYAKVIVLNKRTMEPVKPQTTLKTTIICTKGLMNNSSVTYSGLSERYYTLSSPEGSLSVSGKTVSLSDTPTLLRLKDMSDNQYSFEDYTQPRYRLEYTQDNGVRMYFYSPGSGKQRWIIENKEDGVALRHANGGYLAACDGAVTIQDECYVWQMQFVGETPSTLITALDGFKLMTEAEKQRVMDICTSVGADVFPSAATNGKSFLDTIESAFTSVYLNRNSLTAEEQKEKILDAVSTPVMGSLVDYYTVPSFPGGDAVVTQSAPIKTKHVMWDLVEEDGVIYSASDEHPYTGQEINCYRIEVTYKTQDTEQNVSLYCVDPDFSNVQTAITALGKFPYAYRKNIKTMYVYLSGNTSTYNCGGEELFVRLTGTANESSMIKGFAHELGHSNDYMANGDINNRASHWSQGAKWAQAVTDDIATISTYGNTNSDEGFAEFSRLYWLCYSNRDLQIGIKQLYPNRFASFQRMLEKIGCDSDIIY
ncbi:MAG: hypothetical protein ACI3XA_04805 [Clostridia bacterium]